MSYLTQDLADEYQMDVQPRKKTVEDMLFDLNAASNDDIYEVADELWHHDTDAAHDAIEGRL